MLVISDSAAKKIKSIIDEEDSSLKLRIFVQGGGCSGFQYGLPSKNFHLTMMTLLLRRMASK